MPPIDKACGEGIMPDGLAAARALGIRVDGTLGFPFRGIRFCGEGVAVESAFPHGEGLGLRRTTLHAAMVERATEAGVHLEWGARVIGMSGGVVQVNGRSVQAKWIVGADGGQSRIRRWAGLEACSRHSRRFGFRRHFRIAPWSEYMEIHWGENSQLYLTPVGAEEVCAVVISHSPHLRLEQAFAEFPEVAHRLRGAESAGMERGGASVTHRLRAVCRGPVALIGDASGSVDAITGEGLCLLFQQAAALADALAAGDLGQYQQEHRRLARRPAFMADLMLILDGRKGIRRRALRAMAAKPELFERLLATHVDGVSRFDFAGNGLALGWHMLRA